MISALGRLTGIFLRSIKKRVRGKFFDYSLLFIIIFLIGFGLVMLYSVSSYEALNEHGNAAYYLERQLFFAIIGIIVMLILSVIPSYTAWKKHYWVWYGLALMLEIAVLAMGTEYNGSKRWLTIGPIEFQPSEFTKVLFIIFLAAVLSRMPRQIKNIREVLKIFACSVLIIIPIAKSNLSTAIIVAGIMLIMLFVVGAKKRYVFGLLILVLGAGALFTVVESYRSDRIAAWLHPTEYPDKAYQTLQGLYAIGSGGFFGKGLGGSVQKLSYVPEAQNDFIFTIIVEELGLFGAICVIALYMLMIWRFIVIAVNARDMFGSLLVIGVAAHISLQVILNIAVVTNIMPNTGIILPFISYGGTSLLGLLAEMGLVLNVSRSIPLQIEDTDDKKKNLKTPEKSSAVSGN